MFKLILFHSGISFKEKVYLINKYCIRYFFIWLLYGIEKYFIELDKNIENNYRLEKQYREMKREDLRIERNEKEILFQYVINNQLSLKKANDILKLAAFFEAHNLNLMDLFKSKIDIHKYKVLYFRFYSESVDRWELWPDVWDIEKL